MGTISVCEPKLDHKNSQKEIKTSTKYAIKRKSPINKISLIKENNPVHNDFLKYQFSKKIFNNYSPKVKDSSKFKFYDNSILNTKNSSNKCKTNSYNSLTTNNNSNNINNKRISTTDNSKKITVSEEDTICSPTSVDYSNNLNILNYKNNKKMEIYNNINNKINREKKRSNCNQQIFNIINEENEDLINLSKIYDAKNKNKKNRMKEFYLFSSNSNTCNKRNKNNKLNNPHLSPQLTMNNFKKDNEIKKISKIPSYFIPKSELITNRISPQKTTIYKKIKNNKIDIHKKSKKVKINLNELDKNDFDENENKYFISEINTVQKCSSYNNENNLIKRLQIAKKQQEKEIMLLKMKVNSLFSIIEDNKNLKEFEIKKKDKLISDLQKDKIKNENIIKKLKNKLKKETINYNKNSLKKINDIQNKYTHININSNPIKRSMNIRLTKNNFNIRNDNISQLNTEYNLNNKGENNTEFFKNIVYKKKNRKCSENVKKKMLRESNPIRLNIDLTNSLKKPLIQKTLPNLDIKYKDTNFMRVSNSEDKKELSKKLNNYIIELNNFNRNKRNKSDFEEKIINSNKIIFNKNENINNLVYIPKKSKLSKKFILLGNNKEDKDSEIGRSKSITNNNNLILKYNNINKKIKNKENDILQKNEILLNKNIEKILKEINSRKPNKKRRQSSLNNCETISLNVSNYLKELVYDINPDITMNLNFSQIIGDNSKNIFINKEDKSLFEIFDKEKIIHKNNFNNIDNNEIESEIIKENKNIKNKKDFKFDNNTIYYNKSPILKSKIKNVNEDNPLLNIINLRKNYSSRNFPIIWKLTFIITEEKIELNLKKNILLCNAVNILINKIKSLSLDRKFSDIINNKEKLFFISNNIILNMDKTLEENKLNNHSKIFVILDNYDSNNF